MSDSKSFCLSRDEIAELTRTPQRARQVRFLALNGIRHYVDAHGWPVVTRHAVTGEGSVPSARAKWQPPTQPWRSNKAPKD